MEDASCLHQCVGEREVRAISHDLLRAGNYIVPTQHDTYSKKFAKLNICYQNIFCTKKTVLIECMKYFNTINLSC